MKTENVNVWEAAQAKMLNTAIIWTEAGRATIPPTGGEKIHILALGFRSLKVGWDHFHRDTKTRKDGKWKHQHTAGIFISLTEISPGKVLKSCQISLVENVEFKPTILEENVMLFNKGGIVI